MWAQPIPTGDLRGEHLRLMQLLADEPLKGSLMNRPVWYGSYEEAVSKSQSSLLGNLRCAFRQTALGPKILDNLAWWGCPLQHPEKSFFSELVTFGVYEPTFRNTWNSDLPHGGNNGAAWYGRGLSSEFQGGLYMTSEFLTLTFRPHVVYQQNEYFTPPRFIPYNLDGTIRYVAEGIHPEDPMFERIDRPFRFGPDPYWTFDMGQSSIRVHYRQLELGLSNETLWWGPGVQNALVMSDNAPGLRHAFLGTREPLALPLGIGDLEFRWIWAWPKDSEYFDLDPIYQRDRFMNGLNVIWSPSFVPGLHLGLARVIHQYVPFDGLKESDYSAIFRPFPKPDEFTTGDFRDESYFLDVNPIASAYFRWVFPESSAEIYGELYKENHNQNLRDFLTQPQHGRGYTLGAQKIVPSDIGGIDFIKFNAEITSLLPSRIDDVRPQTWYYTHVRIKQGHTNRGQILGAAIGPGSTSQYLRADGYFKRGMIGLFLQRMVDNDHFHFEYYQRFFPLGGFKDYYHHQVKLNLGLQGKYVVGPLMLNSSLTWNKHYNYGRFNYGDISHLDWESRPKDDVVNLQFQVGIRYLF